MVSRIACVMFCVLCVASLVAGSSELPRALLGADAHVYEAATPSQESVAALHSLVNEHAVEDEALAHSNIDAEMEAIESAAMAAAGPAPTAFLEKPTSGVRRLNKLRTRGYKSNSKEDFISRPLDYSPSSDKLYRSAKRRFARSQGKSVGGKDADISRLQLLANQLKMKRLTVERQKIEITNDEVKVAHLHDLLDANKNILAKNEASLKRSAKSYLDAVKTYTNKIDSSIGNGVDQATHKKAVKAAADNASSSANKAASSSLSAEREKTAKLQAELKQLSAKAHGAGGVHNINQRESKLSKKGGKKGAKAATKGAKKGAAKGAAKKGAAKKGAKKAAPAPKKDAKKAAKQSRFQQIFAEIESSEQESDRLINSTEGDPALLEEEELLPVHLSERLRENQQEVSALIESTPGDLAEHDGLAGEEYTVIPN